MTNKRVAFLFAGLAFVAASISYRWWLPTPYWPDRLNALITELESPKPHERAHAAMEIGFMKKRAAAAVPSLIGRLGDSNELVRYEAGLALNRIGPAAVPALLGATKNKDGRVRFEAAKALGHPELKITRGLSARDDEVIIPALAGLLAMDDEPEVRAAAADSLRLTDAKCTQWDMAIAALIAGSAERDIQVQIAAVHALGFVGRNGGQHELLQTALERLVTLLKHPSAKVRAEAVWSLENYGSLAKPAMGEIAATVFDPEEAVRSGGHRTLMWLREHNDLAIPVLVDGLQSKSAQQREDAVRGLCTIGPLPVDVLPPLLNSLRDESSEVRRYAAHAIGQMGPGAIEACDDLRSALNDAPADLKFKIGVALWQIARDGEEAAPLLMLGLYAEEARRRESAAYWLREIGPAARAAIPSLQRLAAEDENSHVRRTAKSAIEKINAQ